MNILLTGGAGYIGSHMAQRLIELSEKPVIYDNLSTGKREAIPHGAQFVFGDIRDQDLLGRAMKDFHIDTVVHFAARSVVPESIEKPLEYYESNVVGTLQLVNACKKAKVENFIFSSSASVYGDPKSVPLTETSPLKPTSPYGNSKKMAEEIIRDAGSKGLSYVILRYFNVAGAREDLTNGPRNEAATHLVKVAAEAGCAIKSGVNVYGNDYQTKDGTGLRDYIHVEDLVEAHIAAIKYLRKGGESQILNCGYGHGYTVMEVLETMRKVSGRNFDIINQPRRPGDVGKSFADARKIKEVLSWHPKRNNLEAICRTAFAWEKKYRFSKEIR